VWLPKWSDCVAGFEMPRLAVMAVIERIGNPESRPYVVAWGRLTEEDEGRLLARVLTSRHVDVTVDLCEIEEVTDEGCTAIKNVAEYMGEDQTMVVLYKPTGRRLDRSSGLGSRMTAGSCSSHPRRLVASVSRSDPSRDAGSSGIRGEPFIFVRFCRYTPEDLFDDRRTT
jgi:hypothetical protein